VSDRRKYERDQLFGDCVFRFFSELSCLVFGDHFTR
jgi:hypothetical protein